MNKLFKKNRGSKALPTAAAGFFVGLHLFSVLFFLLLPSVAGAADSSLCRGQYPCYTPAACAKAEGEFALCPGKCQESRGYCFAAQDPVPLSINIGSISQVVDVGAYIEAVYTYSIGVAAVVATVMLMVGGFQWLTAAGDAGRVSSAKKRINDALIGLLLTVFAWTILYTINPDLIRLQMPRVPMVRKQQFVSCDAFKMEKACGEPFGLAEVQGSSPTDDVTKRYSVVEKTDGNSLMDCIGKSCTLAGQEDGVKTCQALEPDASGKTQKSSSCSGCVEGWDCVSCTQHGEDCRGIGVNSACCGGYCGPAETSLLGGELLARLTGSTLANMAEMSGSCSNGMHGTPCGSASECLGSNCVDLTRWGSLADPRTWMSGIRVIGTLWSGGICMNGSTGTPCNEDSDCSNGLICIDDVGVYTCSPGVAGSYCSEDSHCTSSRCDTVAGKCANSSGNNRCSRDEQCADYGPDYRCANMGGVSFCTNYAAGTVCTSNDQCASGHCYLGGIGNLVTTNIGLCTDGIDGNGCDDAADCESGTCFNGDGIGYVCIGPNGAGGPCVNDSGGDSPGPSGQGGCIDGFGCHPLSKTCVPSS